MRGHTRVRATGAWGRCPHKGHCHRPHASVRQARATGRSRLGGGAVSCPRSGTAGAGGGTTGAQVCVALQRGNRPCSALVARTLSSGQPSPKARRSSDTPTCAPGLSLTCTPGERCNAVVGCTVVWACDTCLMMVVGVTCRAIRGVPGAWKTRTRHLKGVTRDSNFPPPVHLKTNPQSRATRSSASTCRLTGLDEAALIRHLAYQSRGVGPEPSHATARHRELPPRARHAARRGGLRPGNQRPVDMPPCSRALQKGRRP